MQLSRRDGFTTLRHDGMNNDPTYNRLRELSWRRQLTDAEQAELRAWLEAHPEAREDWDAEAGLESALGRLPNAPVPGNFTARVLQAIERETAAANLPRGTWWAWPRLRTIAVTACMVLAFGATLQSYLAVQRGQLKELADSVAAVADVSSLPSAEVLQDFEAIRAASSTVTPDEELLAALQ
jgi:hypothetical protein